MHNFKYHSNESVCRKSGRLGLEQVLDVYACDIQNVYLQSSSSEKHFILCGPEFCLENVKNKALIICALYGGNRAGADYWRHV